MTEKIATRLATIAVENDIIQNEDYELYIYSYQILIERVVSWMCILLISLYFGALSYTLIFVSFYGILHMFTGGWHASSFGLCFVSSVGIFLAFLLAEPAIATLISANIMLGIIICCGLTIGWLGPIADPNKPLDTKSMIRCRKISIVILLVEISIAYVIFAIGNDRILVFIGFSFAMICASLLIAHCKTMISAVTQ